MANDKNALKKSGTFAWHRRFKYQEMCVMMHEVGKQKAQGK